MTTPLVVYTCITGGKATDGLKAVIAPQDDARRKVRYVCFTDSLTEQEGLDLGWEILPPLWRHEKDHRRTSRWHKVNSHRCFDNPLVLWHDATHQLCVNPWEIVDKHLGASHVASFKHPQRDCVYDELQACLHLKKDDPTVMAMQVNRYRMMGYPAHHGLLETTLTLRRNELVTRRFNDLWWREIVEGSVRDQLSVGYALWKSEARVAIVPGSRTTCKYFNFTPHCR